MLLKCWKSIRKHRYELNPFHTELFVGNIEVYRKISDISRTKFQNLLVSSCICLCPIYWSQVLSREWRCSWSSADRRCSNCIWVINNLIAYWGATYIKDLTVFVFIIILNPLRAKFFRGNIKHIFIFHVTPLHWYDTGGWDPSSNKPRTYPFYIVNIMAAGVLATQGAISSYDIDLVKPR